MVTRDVTIEESSPGFLDHDYVGELFLGKVEGVDHVEDLLGAVSTSIDVIGNDYLLAGSNP